METTTIPNRSLGLRVWVVENTRAQKLQAAKPDVFGTVSVCIIRMVARLANKLGLRLPVCFLRVPTLAALTGGISRIDLNQRNTCYRALVGQKSSKLSEAPAMQPCPLPLSGPDPRPDAGQFLDGNSTVRAFRGLDYAFGNCVINVAGEIRLAFAALFQKTLCGLGSLALQFAPKGSVPVANLVQMGAGVVRSVRIVGNLHDAHVHPKNINRLDLLVLRDINGDIQKPLPFAENQVGLAARIGKQSALPLAADKRHLGASVERPDTHSGWNQVQRKDTSIVGDASVLTEDPLNLLVQLVCVNHLGVEKAHDLSGQRKFVPNLTVESFVERKSAKLLRVPSQLRETIGRTVHSLNRLTQGRRLLRRWQQFNLDSQLHFN